MGKKKESDIKDNSSQTPNPGSNEAIDAGCTCAVIDNCRGRGCGYTDKHGKPLFWITEGCPLHAPKIVIDKIKK